MANIVFAAMPLSGAMNGTIHVALKLRERGHHVYFIGIKDCEDFVVPYGFELIVLSEKWFPKGFMRRTELEAKGFKLWLGLLKMAGEMRKFFKAYHEYLVHYGYEEFRAALEKLEPDLLVIEGTTESGCSYGLMAYKSSVRCVYLNTAFPFAAAAGIPPLDTTWMPAKNIFDRIRIALAWNRFFFLRYLLTKLGLMCDWSGYARFLARSWGYPLERVNTRTFAFPSIDIPEIYICPAQFDFPGNLKKGRYYFEPSIDLNREGVDFPWEKINPEKKLIYCSLGSIFYNSALNKKFLNAVIDAVSREKDWQLAMNTGKGLSREDFPHIPADTILVNVAPQLQILQKAASMITHGGLNSIKECIFFNVPMVVYPISFDQPGNSARVSYHGLGKVGNLKKATPASIHALIQEVLSDTGIRNNLEKMSKIFRESEEKAALLEWIQNMAGEEKMES